MLRQYFTLEKIVDELNLIISFKLVDCFTQEKNTLILCFYNEIEIKYLQISCNNINGGIFFRKNFNKAKSNVLDVFPQIIDSALINVSLYHNDRIIELSFENFSLIINLYGAAKSNVFLINKNNTIIDTFKFKKNYLNKTYLYNGIQLPKITDDYKIFDYLKRNLVLGKYYSIEFCIKHNIDKNISLNSLKEDELNQLNQNAYDFIKEIQNSKNYYILSKNDSFVFCLIPLANYDIVKNFEALSPAIEYFIVKFLVTNNYENNYNSTKNELLNKINKIQAIIEQISSQENVETLTNKYRNWADLLLSQTNPNKKYGDSVCVKDWNNNFITIPLNKELNLIENANYFYSKIRSVIANEKKRNLRLVFLKTKILQLNQQLIELQKVSNNKELIIFKKSYSKTNKNIKTNTTMIESTKFRTYDLQDGYILYVGRNAANNDELTVKFAKPNDIWLHARGSGGAHAVLRTNSKQEKPPKYILEKAASITAYYSQQKTSKYAPVCYTLKKYVHKPRGAAAGSVSVSRESVIMAIPMIPDGIVEEQNICF